MNNNKAAAREWLAWKSVMRQMFGDDVTFERSIDTGWWCCITTGEGKMFRNYYPRD